MSSPLAPVLADTARAHQFTVLSETDHHDASLMQELARPENMQAMAQQGVRHLFIERPLKEDVWLQAYQDGQRSKEDFRTNMIFMAPVSAAGATMNGFTPEQSQASVSALTAVIEQAQAHGIRVHFADAKNDSAEYAAMEQAMRAADWQVARHAIDMIREKDPVQASILEQKGQNGQLTREDGVMLGEYLRTHLPPDRLQALADQILAPYEAAKETWNRVRIDGDRDLADRIKSISGTDKAAVYYGSAHGVHADDLDNHLGNSGRILLANKPEALDLLRPQQEDLMDQSRRPDSTPPVGVYMVKEGRFYSGTPEAVVDLCQRPTIDLSSLRLCTLPSETPAPAVESQPGPVSSPARPVNSPGL